MENKYLKKLKTAALTAFKNQRVKIILFGSRARADNHKRSDVDIGLLAQGKLDKRKLLQLKEKVESLNLPYKVEIVDFSAVSKDFKKEAMKGAVLWKD